MSAPRIRARSGAAITHDSRTVTQATSEPRNASGVIASATAAGTMPPVLFTEACISITSSRLPFVFQYSQAIATDRAVTCSR